MNERFVTLWHLWDRYVDAHDYGWRSPIAALNWCVFVTGLLVIACQCRRWK